VAPAVLYRGLDGLGDRRRSGRPRVFPAAVVAEVKAVACELPTTRGVPTSRWSLADLREELIATRLVDDIAISTLWRWLDADPIKPWQHRSWIFPRDPDFAVKAGRVLDLYQRWVEDRRLEPGEFVISADEKTSIQARCRCHLTLPPGRARAMRVEHEYERGGALAYLAAWDVHQARLFGRCEPTTGIEPFGRLVEQVMASEPYASARQVFWVVDNGSSHRGRRRSTGSRRMAQPHPGSPAGARLLAEPGRAVLLGRAAQGADPQRLRRPGRG
jgi:homeodomain-containing protein